MTTVVVDVHPNRPAIQPVDRVGSLRGGTFTIELSWSYAAISFSTRLHACRASLVELFAGHGGKSERNLLIRQAHLAQGYTLKAIAAPLGLHYSTVSKAFAKAEQTS
ncbi:MAG: hypothetical protein WC001_02270 [Desulfurivibrionaceae bacterium]